MHCLWTWGWNCMERVLIELIRSVICKRIALVLLIFEGNSFHGFSENNSFRVQCTIVYFNLWLIKISWDIYCTSMNIWFRWPSQQRHPQQLPQLGNIYELVIVYTIDVYTFIIYKSCYEFFSFGQQETKIILVL